MTETPKPTLLLVAMSVLVIGFSLFLVSVAIAAFTVTWDPCSLIGGAIILPLPVALAIQQYRATFRGVGPAALTAAILLFIVGGFAAFAFATTFGEIAMGGGELPWLSLLLPMLAVAIVGLFGGWLNLRWRRNLPLSATDSGWRFSLREILAAVAAISLLTGLTASFIRSTPPRYAENVSVADAPFGLPASAADVSFCQGFRGTIAYEFTVDEISFREWVADGIGSIESNASNTELEPITTPVSITRYNAYSSDLNGPDSVTVNKGLHYSWSFEDRGVYAVFDSTTNRAYYFAHFH